MMQRLAVRQLAEFIFRQGDLHPNRQSRAVEAQEGIECQQRIQASRKQRSEKFEAEVSVHVDVTIDGVATRLAGRIDGLLRNKQGLLRVEEYKTTREVAVALNPVDWGQCLIYGALLSEQESLSAIELAVVYVHPDSLAEQVFESSVCAKAAQLSLALALLCYEVRLRRHRLRCERRMEWMRAREFPFAQFRAAQRAMAQQVYQSLRAGEHLLLEAPTGSGKSMATIYPALKLMQPNQKLFFLTNRTTGAEAALNSLRLIADSSRQISVVQLTAREKICQNQGVPCDPQTCPGCKNYYARAPHAINRLLECGIADRLALQQVADEFTVCPFELSLDLALWADVIIGDYNYLFDPFVKLQRFSDASNHLLLIDEAHQLSSRVTLMLGAEFALNTHSELLESPSDDFSAAAHDVFDAVRALSSGSSTALSRVIERPLQLEAAAERLIQRVDSLQLFETLDSEAQDLYFACIRWVRSLEWFQPARYQHLSIEHEQGCSIQRLCLDSADYINDILNSHAATVRLSATVSPLALYQRLHGCPGQRSARATSPFGIAQSAVMIVRDIPTYFRQRGSSLPKLSELVNMLVEARPGRYLIAFASYTYLQAFAEQHNARGHVFRQQRSGERAEELQQHKQFIVDQPSVVFGVVMGGSFSESVEFGEGQLSGVIVVGIGLPPPSLQGDLTAQYFDENEGKGWGQMVAYTQPALTKAIQMAGRLLRSEQDRGVICLVDERFLQPQIQGFMPAHWSTKSLTLRQVKSAVNDFWRVI